MSMNYAAAVASGRGQGVKPNPVEKKNPPEPDQNQKENQAPQQAQETRVKVEPQQQVQPQQKSTPAPQQEQVVARTYPGNNGGSFSVLTETAMQQCITAIAMFLDPVSHLAIGTTCKYLLLGFLNQNTWNLAQSQLPRPMKVVIRVEIQISIKKDNEDDDSGFTLEDVEADGITPEANICFVGPSFFRKEARKQQLQKVWKYNATTAQKTRDKQWEKEAQDVLLSTTTKKPPIELKFPGGFYIAYRESKPKQAEEKGQDRKENFIARGADLSDLSLWLDSTLRLIQGEKKVSFATGNNTKLTISKYGRGGSQLALRTSPKGAPTLFYLSDFALQLRSAAKEFIPVLGRISMLINQDVKNVTKEDNEAYLEYEKGFNTAFKHAKINSTVSNIKQALERGAIPHSNIQKQLQKKRAQKKQVRAQTEIENSNILDFIYFNLPPDLAEVRTQAQRQTEEAERMREQAKALSEAERERRRQEKKLAKEAQKAEAASAREGKGKKNQKEIEEEEKTKKTKTKAVKTVDTEGFVTLDTEYTKLNEDGKKIETIKASDKKKEEEKENEKKKKPGTVSASPTLQNNPFAQIKHAAGVQSQQEVQAKINAKKGEQRNLENNEMQQKEKKKPAPIPIQPKKQKEKKPKKDAAENSSEETAIVPATHQSSVAMNPQPFILVAFGVALAVVGYVFMLG